MREKFITATIKGDAMAIAVATRLISASQWFMADPLPDGFWAFTIKESADRFVSWAVKEVRS